MFRDERFPGISITQKAPDNQLHWLGFFKVRGFKVDMCWTFLAHQKFGELVRCISPALDMAKPIMQFSHRSKCHKPLAVILVLIVAFAEYVTREAVVMYVRWIRIRFGPGPSHPPRMVSNLNWLRTHENNDREAAHTTKLR